MRFKKTFEVTVEVDRDEAREIKGGKPDWDAYPNWDINYLGDEEQFIKTLIHELKQYNQYSGITVKAVEKK